MTKPASTIAALGLLVSTALYAAAPQIANRPSDSAPRITIVAGTASMHPRPAECRHAAHPDRADRDQRLAELLLQHSALSRLTLNREIADRPTEDGGSGSQPVASGNCS